MQYNKPKARFPLILNNNFMFITPSFLLIALSVFYAIILIPAILLPKEFQKAMKEITGDRALLRVTGLFTVLVSFLFLSVHWKFTGGWFILIPIMGWGALLKGTTMMLFPKFTYLMVKKTVLSSEAVLGWMAFIGLLIAIGLAYVALYIY